MQADPPPRVACEVLLEGDVAVIVEQYRRTLNRDLRRRGWPGLSQGDLVRAVVERFLRDHQADILAGEWQR